MRTIFKYALPTQDRVTFVLPKGAEILKIDVQLDQPFIWALINPEAASEERFFRVAGTGHPIEDKNLKFIDTFQMHGGDLVFHVFEVMK